MVYSDKFHEVCIDHASFYIDYICLSLTAIPYRIDVVSSGAIWLFGEKSSKLFNEPYKSLDDETSKTVFQKGVTEC